MTRLFRNTRPGWADYAALAAFGLAYVAALALVLAPARGAVTAPEPASAQQQAEADGHA
jgi:hypothetical protein